MNASDTFLSTEPLRWSDALLLGYAPMDTIHREFVELLYALQTAPDNDLPYCLEIVETHAKEHFDTEDQWMLQSDFPARECHMNEHAAVLQSVRQVRARLVLGEIALCRHLTVELARWFPGHADYLDSALSHWMCEQRLGGKPVVLRRNIGAITHDVAEQEK